MLFDRKRAQEAQQTERAAIITYLHKCADSMTPGPVPMAFRLVANVIAHGGHYSA